MNAQNDGAQVLQIDRRRLAEKDKPRDRKAEAKRRLEREAELRARIEREALAELAARGVAVPKAEAEAATPIVVAEPPRPPRAPRPPRPVAPPIVVAPPVEVVPPGPLGVVDQVRLALRPGSRLAFVLGCLLGAVVPFATFHTAHNEIDFTRPLYVQPAAWFAAGGLLFSAVTMYGWGKLAFLQRTKALGFVLLLEGTMVTSHSHWLAVTALVYLCGINGVATACNLAGAQWRK